MSWIKKPYRIIRKWFDNSPYIVKVDKRHLKLLQAGEYGDVVIIGKTFEDPDNRVVGVKGNSNHAISLDDEWAEDITNKETHKVSTIKVFTETGKKIIVICETECDLIDSIYKVDKK